MYRPDEKIAVDTVQENSFTSFVKMEDIIEKLKLLDYEKEFVRHLNMKPITKHYFMVPKNPGVQFYMFTSIAAWLIRKCGKTFDQPQEYDDPNSTIANILNFVREFGHSVDFPPSKLKQGIGDHVVYVLDCFTNQALFRGKFGFQPMRLATEETPEVDNVEDEAELILDRVEEEMIAAYSDESDEENVFRVEDLQKRTARNTSADQTRATDLAQVDLEQWRLEVERVLPRLKVTVRTDGRDWRSHLEQMKAYRDDISGTLDGTRHQLERLRRDVSAALEKIASRERHLNSELEPSLERYRGLQDELSRARERYRGLSGGTAERTRELARLTERLEAVRQQMEDRGSSMTDGTPLINIKKAVSKVKAELAEMDVRIGVLENTLLQARIKDKSILDEDVSLAV